MTDFLDRYGQWGMVAGAAEGLGRAFCEELARKRMNLVMIDINVEGMESLAAELGRKYGIESCLLTIDLGEPGAAGNCMEAIRQFDCRLLVYNAAFSRVRPFLDTPQEELDLYINVNTRTPLKLVYSFVEMLKSGKRSGGVLLMSSLAGIWGTRLVSIYSGTKAFNLLLAEALYHELQSTAIDVSACCAGATATPAYLATNPAKGLLSPPVMKPEKVAAIAIRNLGRKPVIIPGAMNRINYFLLTRILPRKLSVSLVNRMMARTYKRPG